jgi:exopolyphosphatase / guanosine-5'-triphosphate,3'-diphosphate pyrophosphatase
MPQKENMLAAIDLGSNSFRLHVGRHDGNTIEVVRSAREPTRMASGLDQYNVLSGESIRCGIDALYRLGDVLQAYKLGVVRAVATNTLRVAKNASEFMSVAEKALGYPIEIISGEEEARLIYLGIAHQLARAKEERLVIDIGGGSTELIVGRGYEVERAKSIEIGTVWQSQNFFRGGKLDAAGFDAAVEYARSRFNALFSGQPPQWKNVYGSSGTMRAIGEIIARNNLGDEGITPQSLDALKHRLLDFGRIDKIAMEKIRAERAESIVGGLAILIGLTQELGIKKLRPVEGGLRLGVMWDLYLRGSRSG